MSIDFSKPVIRDFSKEHAINSQIQGLKDFFITYAKLSRTLTGAEKIRLEALTCSIVAEIPEAHSTMRTYVQGLLQGTLEITGTAEKAVIAGSSRWSIVNDKTYHAIRRALQEPPANRDFLERHGLAVKMPDAPKGKASAFSFEEKEIPATLKTGLQNPADDTTQVTIFKSGLFAEWVRFAHGQRAHIDDISHILTVLGDGVKTQPHLKITANNKANRNGAHFHGTRLFRSNLSGKFQKATGITAGDIDEQLVRTKIAAAFLKAVGVPVVTEIAPPPAEAHAPTAP